MTTTVKETEAVKVQRALTEIELKNVNRVMRQLFSVKKMGDLIPLETIKTVIYTVKTEAVTLFDMCKVIPFKYIGAPIFEPTKEKFSIYKTTGGKPLGTVGKVFEPMQPSEFLTNIVETVKDYGAELDLETLTFTEFCGGSRIEFRIEIEPIRFKNVKQRAKTSGKTLTQVREDEEDITKLYLTFTTSYNGTKPNVISLFTERLICTNGMVANKLEGTLKGRNTMNGKLKILSYGEEVAKIINGTKDFKEKMIELDKIPLDEEKVEELKLKIFGFNAETERIKKEKMKNPTQSTNEKLLEKIDKSIKMEFHRTGQTAFGLLQGVTHYTNHVANVKENVKQQKYSNSEYIRFNQGVIINNKAQELLFNLIKERKAERELVLAN